jgi:hypothetical protein
MKAGIAIRFPPDVAAEIGLPISEDGLCRLSAIQLAGLLTLHLGVKIDPTHADEELRAWALAQAATRGLMEAREGWREIAWRSGLGALIDAPEQVSRSG